MAVIQVDRRDFLKITSAASAGMILGVTLPARAHDTTLTVHDLGAFIQIGTDDQVTIWVSKSDMGQDVRTALPMIIAEEMDADWAKVKIKQAPLDRKFGRQGTGGSSSIRTMWTPLRNAGATAKAMLVGAAAAAWNVDPASIEVDKSVLLHRASGKKGTFGEFADAAAKVTVAQGKIKLKDPKQFRIVGKAARRIDTTDIMTGKATYGIDVKVPGMLYAVIARSPVFGGTVASFDATKAKAIAGVKDVVEVKPAGTDLPWSGVAVVANSTWAAMQGRDALEIKWNEGPHANESSESLLQRCDAALAEAKPVVTKGDPDAALANAAQTLKAVYELPFLAHAAMEPLNATAHVKPDGAELWLSTQFPGWAGPAAAQALGLKPEQVKVNVTMLGGGFGRRANPDFAIEAVQISKAVGAPVHVQWTREDDMTHDFYRPASFQRMTAGLDDQGNVIAWHHRIAAPSINAYFDPGKPAEWFDSETPGVHDMPYEVPNFRVDFVHVNSGVPRGWWRSVEHSINGFVVNGFLDELAYAAGRDPIELRLAMLPKGFVQKFEDEKNPSREWPYMSDRLRGVIELAREKSGWGKRLPAGRAHGFAAHYSFLSYTAEVAEVSIDKDGRPKIHKVTCAVDCGVPVNPEGIRAQMEGGIVYGLAAALGQKITIEKGRVQQSNFHDFPLLTIAQMPVVEVHIVPSTHPPTGTGEPGLPPAAAAVANAMFKLTGTRIRRLPIV